MRERNPSALGDHDPQPGDAGWDIRAISDSLLQLPEAARDAAHGAGLRYDLDDALRVELFPPSPERRFGVVRVETADSRQEFFRAAPPSLRRDGVIFASGDHLVAVTAAGQVTTHRDAPAEGPERPAAARNGGEGPEGHDAPETAPSGDSAAPETVSPMPSAPTEGEGQPRVAYGGRLGIDPRTRTTAKGRFVMEFPVAVAVDGQEAPDWRDTLVFDARARKLDGVLAKGDYVDVVAYEHHKLKTDDRTGARREVREFYATSVARRPRSGQDAPASASPQASSPEAV